jgi:hypothetical protein
MQKKKNNWFYRVFQKFCAKPLRVCVFQLGEYKKFSILRKIIQRYEKKPHFTLKEIDYYLKILEEIGGEKNKKRTEDGLAIIEYMILRAENIKRKIKEKGGIWKEVKAELISDDEYSLNPKGDPIHVIYRPFDDTSEEWKVFFSHILKEMGWKKITLIDENKQKKSAYITSYNYFSSQQEKICFLRCHSPGRSFPMETIYIGSHLGIGCDICLFDYRGTYNSTGRPTEGGYYLDADSVFNELIQSYNYDPKNIWVTGFSLGSSVAAFIKKKYHHLGVNYIAENAFSSLEKLISSQNWFIAILGKAGLGSIESKKKEITSIVEQDHFNTLGKCQYIEKLDVDVKSTVIVIHTDQDSIVPKDSSILLYKSAKRFGFAYHLIHKKENKNNEGHMERPLEDHKIWAEYVKIIFDSKRKERPEDISAAQ